MQKLYKVAGHVFSLDMPENNPAWARLGNYTPFEITSPEKTLFSLEVVEKLEEPEKEPYYVAGRESGEPVIDIFRCASGWWVETYPTPTQPIAGRVVLSEDFTKGRLAFTDDPRFPRFAIDNALMLMFAFCTSPYNTLELHSSVIMREGKAYLFLAKSGTGKSTQSRMWLENIPGSELLNDDNPVLRIDETGKVVIYGSPWSGKTPCYRNLSAQAGAFVGIRHCKDNLITPLDIISAYAQLSGSSSGFRPLEWMAEGMHNTLAAAVEAVPSYILDCRPDPESAIVCSNEVCIK